MNEVKIADQRFAIVRSEFAAYLSIGQNGWSTRWDIELECEQREINEIDWAPIVSSHFFNLDLSPSTWQSHTRTELPTSEEGEAAFLVSIFEHETLDAASISATWLGNTLSLNLTGSVDVNADENYGQALPLEVQCELAFTGVIVDEHHFPQAIEQFSRFFDPLLYEEPSRHTNGGVIFRPLPCSARVQQ